MTSTQPIPARPDQDRLDVLDGLRGIAALMVVAFHFGARWTAELHVASVSLYPYGDIFLDAFSPLRYFGRMGILLFFMISGFVIMLTLRRCNGLLDFSGRRFARLWPTMLICATLTTLFVNGTGIHARFEGTAYWEVFPGDYLFSIFFLDPGWTGRLIGWEGLGWVDGVYWTLWVEVRFYALVGLVFWLFRGERFVWAWLIVQALSASEDFLIALFGFGFPNSISLVLQPDRLAWFTIGIAGYFYWNKSLRWPMLLAAMIALMDILLDDVFSLQSGLAAGWLTWTVIYTVVLAPFILFLLRSPLMKPFASSAAVTIGIASYPLYLFHERIGIIGTTYLSDWGVPPLVAMVITLALLIGFAIWMSKMIEGPAKRLILSFWNPRAAKLEARHPLLMFAKR